MWPWRENSSTPDQNPMSVIDQGCEFEGRLTFVGTLILNGKLKGEVQSSGTLIVREGGEIQADVRVGVAIVSGQISGHVTAQERVELKKTARIFGDILTPVLSLEEGVVFDGHCEMKGEGPRVLAPPETKTAARCGPPLIELSGTMAVSVKDLSSWRRTGSYSL